MGLKINFYLKKKISVKNQFSLKINFEQRVCDFEIPEFKGSFMVRKGPITEYPTIPVVSVGYLILNIVFYLFDLGPN